MAQLAQIKELSGLSLRSLARDAGLSSSSLSRYLTGRLVPPWEAVVALCRVVRRDPRPLRAVWAEAARAGPAAAPRRNDLPADLFDFTGRDEECARVEELLRTAGAATVDGMAGVGKTSLALHVAHRLASAYPDGGWYLDLQGFTPGREPLEASAALARLLAGLEVDHPPADVAGRAALWRSELSRRRALVVLDNAADAEQVRPLLPGAGKSAVLVTSRNRLVSLDAAPPVSLAPLADGDAARLFGRAAGLSPADDAIGEVLRECGGLPLALRMAGARLRHRPGWTVAVLAERLRDNAGRFDAVFGMSLQQLDGGQRRLFRLLGVLPGADFDAGVATALAERPAGPVLEELVDAHLVQETSPGRYRLHDLIRRYAADLAAEEETRSDDAVRRVLDHYLAQAVAHDRVLPRSAAATTGGGRPGAGDRLVRPGIREPGRRLRRGRAAGAADRVRVARSWRVLVGAGRFPARPRALRAGREPGGQAQALAFDGWAALHLGDRPSAAELALASLALAEGPARIPALITLGLAGEMAALDEALRLAEENDLRHQQAWCHSCLGIALREAGRYDEALAEHRRALELLEPLAEAQLEADCRRAYAETLQSADRRA